MWSPLDIPNEKLTGAGAPTSRFLKNGTRKSLTPIATTAPSVIEPTSATHRGISSIFSTATENIWVAVRANSIGTLRFCVQHELGAVYDFLISVDSSSIFHVSTQNLHAWPFVNVRRL